MQWLKQSVAVCAAGFLLTGSNAFGEYPVEPTDSKAKGTRSVHLPEEVYDYKSVQLPEYASEDAARFDNTPHNNPITNDGATLGRVLFYDPTLSKNGSTSCASCHQQKFAFTDSRRYSEGFEGREVERNSMSLVNLRYYKSGKFFWDERAETLEQQVLMPIENPIEMGHSLNTLMAQLQQDPIYPPLFEAAFGDTNVTTERVAKALSQFIRAIVSVRSKYDLGRAQVASVLDPFPNFTAQQNYGKEQFFGRAKCAECHLPDASLEHRSVERRQSTFFHLLEPVVNGIDSDLSTVDGGVGKVTGNPDDWGRFKASSLRNIELTAPYMHDGRFHTLDQVIEHYNWSVKPHRNLDARLQDFADNGLALPEVEKVALAEFLRTLTDETLISDPRFSDPFAPPEAK